jgi:carotenoid cleavage dioxygenase
MQGNYGPVKDELTEFDLEVTGAIPPELDGLYLRNGSNPRGTATSHWFFGDGMVHGVRLEKGQASWYRNRWVKTPKLEGDLDAMDPGVILDRTASAANTHVIGHAGKILCLEEGHFPWEITPELETVGSLDYGGKLTSAFTAHPKLCPETDELHFFGYGPMPPFLTYHVLDAKGDLVHSAEIEVPGPTMMHDFIITRDHAIFMDLPVCFDLSKLAEGGTPLTWDESYGARIGIVPRMGTNDDIRWFEIDPCYVFHPMNAFVDGNKVVCDVGRHEYMWRESMEDFAPSYLTRWTFDLETGAKTETQLDDLSHGFPRVDDRKVGLPNRYGWAIAERDPGTETSMDDPAVVVKYDLEKGGVEKHDLGAHGHPAEFVFAEASDSAGEDEGWLMGFVYDSANDSSDLVILDAQNISGDAVAKIHLPQRVPFGFHGSWIRS